MKRINFINILLTLILLAEGSPAQPADGFERPVNMTIRQFDTRVRKADKPLVVCFSADTSLICRQQAEQLKQLLVAHGNELEVVWIDMIANPRISQYFGVNLVPVLILYIQAFPVWLRIGYLPQEQILQFLYPYTITQ
jgi:thioredoxin 1